MAAVFKSIIKQPELMVSTCVLSLASNITPETHLNIAHRRIAELGDVQVSPVNVSAVDSEVPAYHNQVAYLTLNDPMDYFELLELTKALEQQSQRQQYQKPFVTLDIDIIAIQVNENSDSMLLDEKQTAFLPLDTPANDKYWLGIARRLPLADYDRLGVSQLSSGHKLDFLLNT